MPSRSLVSIPGHLRSSCGNHSRPRHRVPKGRYSTRKSDTPSSTCVDYKAPIRDSSRLCANPVTDRPPQDHQPVATTHVIPCSLAHRDDFRHAFSIRRNRCLRAENGPGCHDIAPECRFSTVRHFVPAAVENQVCILLLLQRFPTQFQQC